MASSSKSNDWLDEIGMRLVQTRKVLELTQEELSEALSITRAALGNWETGKRCADIAAMSRMCERFGITLDWIYRGDPSGLPHRLAMKLIDD